MRKIILTLFFFSISQITIGQPLNIDSLFQILDTTSINAVKVRINFNLSLAYQKKNEREKSLRYVRIAKEIAVEDKIEKYLGSIYKQEADLLYGMGKADSAIWAYEQAKEHLLDIESESLLYTVYHTIALHYAHKGKHDESEKNFLAYLALAKKNDNQVRIGRVYQNLGTIKVNAEDYEKAIEYYQKALNVKLKEPIIDSSSVAKVWENIGQVYYRIGEDSIGLIYQYKSLSVFKTVKDTSFITKVTATIGNIYASIDKNDSASKYYRIALPLAEKLGDPGFLFMINSNLAAIDEKNGRYEKALRAMQDSEKYLLQLNQDMLETQRWRSKNYGSIGYILTKLNRTKEGEEYLLKGLKAAEEIDKFEYISLAHKSLADFYKDVPNYSKAYFHFRQFHIYSDSLFSSEKKARLEEYESKYQAERKEKEIAKLQFEKTLQEAESAQKNNQIYLLIGALLLVLLGAGFVVYFLSQRRQKEQLIAQRNLEIQEAKAQELVQNQALKSIDAMLEGQENERVRVARDLHDRLGSTMSMIKLHYSEVVDQLENIQLVNQSNFLMVNDLVDEAISEVRRISHNMSAGTLMEYGLVPALYELKNTIESSKKIELKLHVFNLDFRLKSVAEINLYRVIQELVNNTLKHAQATQIEISLTKRDDILSLMYDDNGVGVKLDSLEEYKTGMGMKNINSRIEKLEGKVHLHSELGKGIHYDIEIPITK